MRIHTRRNVLGLAALSITVQGLAWAINDEELDPSDTVPRRFSVRRFLSLSEAEVYKVNLAARRGRGITSEGYSRSESREIIALAAKDLRAARALLTK